MKFKQAIFSFIFFVVLITFGCSVNINVFNALVTVSPTDFDFGQIEVTTSSGAQTFIVTNDTESAETITDISITGADAGDFSAVPTGAGAWNVGAFGGTFSIDVTFTPLTLGAKTATLDITLTTVTLHVSLSGTGSTIAMFEIAPATPFDFGTALVNGSGVTQDFTVTNNGSQDLTLTNINLATGTDFTITAGGGAGPFTVTSGGGTYVITVQFLPLSSGAKTDTLHIEHDGSNVSSPFDGVLDGLGAAPEFNLIPDLTAYDFGDQFMASTTRKTFSIYNSGDSDLIISSIGLSNTTDYTYQGAATPFTVPANSTREFSVLFNPASVANNLTGNVTIQHNAGADRVVSCTGDGLALPAPIPIHSEDFQANDGGYSAYGISGGANSWQYGDPVSAPVNDHTPLDTRAVTLSTIVISLSMP